MLGEIGNGARNKLSFEKRPSFAQTACRPSPQNKVDSQRSSPIASLPTFDNVVDDVATLSLPTFDNVVDDVATFSTRKERLQGSRADILFLFKAILFQGPQKLKSLKG